MEEETLKKISDIMYSVIKTKYPNLHDEYWESRNETDICDDEDCGEILFYYDWDDKIFYFSIYVLEFLYETIGLELFNLELTIDDEDRLENREKFNKLAKIFANRHFGFSPIKIYLHAYT